MSIDVLLEYLSEVQSGNWEQFKSALQVLQPQNDGWKSGRIARILSSLGHAEFAWEPQARWAICPPALIRLPRRNIPTAILCGQRPMSLSLKIKNYANALNIVYKEIEQLHGPKLIQVSAHSLDRLIKLAAECGVFFAHNTVEQIASCLPSITSILDSTSFIPELPIQPVEYFNAESFVWESVDTVTKEGLYRYENFYPDYRLVINNQWRKTTRELGIYAVIRNSIWKYDSEQHILMIPKGLLPPPLYQRVLVLCSGMLARYELDKGGWIFNSIPPAIGHTLATKLNQILE